MSNDNLESLSDCDLSNAFAVEYAGWTCDALNRFATSADAVLPYLDRCRAWSKGTVGTAVTIYADRLSPAPKPEGVPDCEWMILFPIGNHWNESIPPVPFARAACIALIRAKRAEAKR